MPNPLYATLGGGWVDIDYLHITGRPEIECSNCELQIISLQSTIHMKIHMKMKELEVKKCIPSALRTCSSLSE